MPAEQRLSSEAGLTLIEAAIGSFLTLVLVLAVYTTMDWAQRSFTDNSEDVTRMSNGRAILDLMSTDIRMAGYNPIGKPYNGVISGNTTSMRLLSDRNRNGSVGGGQPEEDITYVFVPVGNGLHEIRRGVDLNGDGVFTGTGESIEVAATEVVQVDGDGDGTTDAFLSYDLAPPATTRARVSFGIRNMTRDAQRRRYDVGPFRSEVTVRSKWLQ